MIFIYKSLLLKLSNYIISLFTFNSYNYSTQYNSYITLDIPHLPTNFGRIFLNIVFIKYALKLESFIVLGDFKTLYFDVFPYLFLLHVS